MQRRRFYRSGIAAATRPTSRCPAWMGQTGRRDELLETRVAMNTSDVLNRAADLIEERGWAKGGGWPGEEDFGGLGVGLCLEGGIMAALGIKMGDDEYVSLRFCPASKAVCDYLDFRHRSLYAWNDASDRTATEVIEVLRAAALIEQAKENAPTEVAAERVTVTVR